MAALIPAYLILGSVLCFYLAYLYGRKTKYFSWKEYFALMSGPVIACLSLSFFYGAAVPYFFAVSCVVGFGLEYIIGFAYHKTLNRRLWTYGKYSVRGYTSLLTFPMWGIAGTVFWLIARSMGL